MLQNFRFARYRFSYTVLEPLRLPPYKGNVFRSQFGYTLRDITCIGDADACETVCQFPEQCVYSRCFETPVPDNSLLLGGQTFAPHPFVLEPPRSGKLEYAPDDRLACDLILIGEAINILPWMVFTFDQIGKKRIGLRGERGRCRLERVESLPARENDAPETIYTAETQMLMREGVILRPADVMAHSDRHVANGIEVDFRTPTSIKVAGRWTSDLRFEIFIRNLLRRIRLLSYFHCGEDLDVDAASLFKAANGVVHESHLRWMRADRWSHRAGASVPMGGFIGKIRYSGDLTPFLPFILLGEHLHIGHHTAFGYGQYRVRGIAV